MLEWASAATRSACKLCRETLPGLRQTQGTATHLQVLLNKLHSQGQAEMSYGLGGVLSENM